MIDRSPARLQELNRIRAIQSDPNFEESEYELYDHDSEESPMEYEYRHFFD